MSRLIATLVAGWAVVAAAPPVSAQDILRPRGGDREIRTVIGRIRSDADSLRRTVDFNAPRSTRSGRQGSTDELSYVIDDLIQSTDHLADHLDRRQVIR